MDAGINCKSNRSLKNVVMFYSNEYLQDIFCMQIDINVDIYFIEYFHYKSVKVGTFAYKSLF